MMNFIFGRQTFCAIAAFALLAGCGGGMSPGQSSTLGLDTAAQLRALGATSAARFSRSPKSDHHGSWMAPDAAKVKNLLYVADQAGNDVLVYSYPAGKLMGTLTGFELPSGICSNKRGDVFILNGNGYPTSSTMIVDVYAHGGRSPIRTLIIPGYPELNCTVDPKTGNLALGLFGVCCGSCQDDCVAVFTKAQGTPTIYTPGQFNAIPGCGYDNSGNLFCDAGVYTRTRNTFELFELPAGGSVFTPVSVSGASSLYAGSVQWDGKDLAVDSGEQTTLYQIRLSGSKGTVVGSTPLYGAGVVGQFWITHDLGGKKHRGIRVIAPSWGQGRAEVGYWNYPAGGSPTKTIHGDFTKPDGVALSTLRK